MPVREFYQNYKSIKRSVERDEHHIMPQAAFLHQCDKQNLIPKAFGLVNMKGKEDEIRSYSMGNNYA